MQPSEHSAHYLGLVPNITIMNPGLAGGSSSPSLPSSPSSNSRTTSPDPENSAEQDDLAIAPRPPEVQLIDRVEAAQLTGALPCDAEESNCPLVRLSFTNHGLKIVHASTQEVLDRVPLHMLAQAVSFDDDLGHYNVVIKVGQVGKNCYSCYVFQTKSQTDATKMCQSLHQVYQSIVHM